MGKMRKARKFSKTLSTEYPIITTPFTIINEGIFRFIKNGPVTYWNSIDQQGVEKLIDGNKWEKISYEESSRIAKLYLAEHKV